MRREPADLVFACAADNDLYRLLAAMGRSYPRYGSAAEAVAAAPAGAGVLVLADGYPGTTTPIEPATYSAAEQKGERLYVEFPGTLPGLAVGPVRATRLERAVVANGAFGGALAPMSLLAVHDCHYVELEPRDDAWLVVAKVAGYDRAVYGLAETTPRPLLFELPEHHLLVSTSKLSQFVTARYAPAEDWRTIWGAVLEWLHPGEPGSLLRWTPTVRPTYRREEALPADAARSAVVRGIDWYTRSRMLVDRSWDARYDEYRRTGVVDPGNPVGPAPDPSWPAGDGELGLLEGVQSTIHADGSQDVRWWRRADCIGESALAFALRSRLDGDRRSATIAANLLDWVYFTSGLFQDDPARGDFGLVHWAQDSAALYGDNDVKIILSAIGTSALLHDDRWDERLLEDVVGNFRTTGVLGFRGERLEGASLAEHGWQERWRSRTIDYAPHYEAWIWATYLWAYDRTHDPLLLERTRAAIERMMRAYPAAWRWTNGIQQERGRMLLPLAWLIRVDDRPEYRAWLRRLALDMAADQDASGAIREELGDPAMGRFHPPTSNADYGRHESSAIQANGDPMADLLYTCNFTFLGLHEAYAATGEPLYGRMADRLADFLVRIQVRSEAHPELDGGWFRAFDFDKWEYWGADADLGWGAWSIEAGWTQAWIPTVLALRALGTSLWDLGQESRVARLWPAVRARMLPADELELPAPVRVDHAAVGAPVRLEVPADPRYPGDGPQTLTDGKLAAPTHEDPGWLGFEGHDLTATVDLGRPRDVTGIEASFLRSLPVGIHLPTAVHLSVSDDGERFRPVGEARPGKEDAGRWSWTPAAPVRARFVRVHAVDRGTIPDGQPGAGRPAWLFADEILVHAP